MFFHHFSSRWGVVYILHTNTDIVNRWGALFRCSIALCMCVYVRVCALGQQCARGDDESSAVFWFPRATMSDRKAVIKNADMSEDMQQDAVECATQALEKYNIEKDIAAYIKKVKKKKKNLSIFQVPTLQYYPTIFPERCSKWTTLACFLHSSDVKLFLHSLANHPVHHPCYTPSLVLPIVSTLPEETWSS